MFSEILLGKSRAVFLIVLASMIAAAIAGQTTAQELTADLECLASPVDNDCSEKCRARADSILWQYNHTFNGFVPMDGPDRLGIFENRLLVLNSAMVDTFVNAEVGWENIRYVSHDRFILDDMLSGWEAKVLSIYGYEYHLFWNPQLQQWQALQRQDWGFTDSVHLDLDTVESNSCFFNVEPDNSDCPELPFEFYNCGSYIYGEAGEYGRGAYHVDITIYNANYLDTLRIYHMNISEYYGCLQGSWAISGQPFLSIPCRSYGEFALDYYPGTKTGGCSKTLTLTTNSTIMPTVEKRLYGETKKADIRIVPTSLSFGEIPIGESATRQITIYNDSWCTGLRVNSVNSSNSAFDIGLSPGRVYSGTQVDVSFSPTSEQSYDGYILIFSNDWAQSPKTIYLSGTGTSEFQITLITLAVIPDEVEPGDNVFGGASISGTGSGDVIYQWLWTYPDGAEVASEAHTTYMENGSASVGPYNMPSDVVGPYSVQIYTINPSFATSNIETYEVLDPCDGPDFQPEIVDVLIQTTSPTPNDVQMNQLFHVLTTVKNKCPSHSITVQVRFRETVSSIDDLQPMLWDSPSLPVTIGPLEEQTIIIPNLIHHWEWIDPWSWKNLISIIPTIVGIPAPGGIIVTGVDVALALGTSAQLLESPVDYEVEIIGVVGSKIGGAYSLRVADAKVFDLAISFSTAVSGAIATAVGVPILEAGLIVISQDYYIAAHDPDSDYATVVVPDFRSVPSEYLSGNALEDTALICTYELCSYGEALTAAYAKYLGAVQHKDHEWELTHLQSLSNLTSACVPLYQYMASYVNTLDPSIWYITPEEFSLLAESIQSNGLPAIEQQVLTDFGFSPNELSEVTDSIVAAYGHFDNTYWQRDLFHNILELIGQLKLQFTQDRVALEYGILGEPRVSADPTVVTQYLQQQQALVGQLESDPTNIGMMRQLASVNTSLDSIYTSTGDSGVAYIVDSTNRSAIQVVDNTTPKMLLANLSPQGWWKSWSDCGTSLVSVVLHSFPDNYSPQQVSTESIRLNGNVIPAGPPQIFEEDYGGLGPALIVDFNDQEAMQSMGGILQSDEQMVVVSFEYASGDEGAATAIVHLDDGPGFGPISGHVAENEAQGLHGVAVDIYDSTGSLWVILVSDSSGLYSIDSIPNGDYTASIATPLGYFVDQELTEFTVAHCPVFIDYMLAQMDITPQQRGRGYWMHQVNALLSGKGNPQETYVDMCNYMELIRTHFNEHGLNPINVFDVELTDDCNQRLEALRETISPKPKAAMNEKARAHMTALLLNMVSGKIAQWAEISEDSATVSQAITYCNYLITDMNPENDEVAKDIAEMIDEGTIVPSGLIDLSTANIAYRRNNTEQLPTEYSLSQNCPNPFNPITEISFAVPEATDVTLEVYNVLGQKIATLVDGRRDAGYHTVNWDGSSVASGVYLYRIEAGDFVESRKMVLLK